MCVFFCFLDVCFWFLSMCFLFFSMCFCFSTLSLVCWFSSWCLSSSVVFNDDDESKLFSMFVFEPLDIVVRNIGHRVCTVLFFSHMCQREWFLWNQSVQQAI